MGDYCNCAGSNNVSQDGNTRTVRLKFLRDQLLYDIKNYAYVEADVMGEEKQHASHVTAEIGEEGNVDRVSRILAVVHASVIDLLYPYTKAEPIEEEIDDFLSAPEVYTVEMHVPVTMSRSTMHLLSRLIHEYMVYRVLADWLSITNAEASANWLAKAAATEQEMERAKNQRGVFARATHPW